MQVGGKCITATQFADDAQVFVATTEHVELLVQALATFEKASGQGLNRHKTKVLLFGAGARHQYWECQHRQWLMPWLTQQEILLCQHSPEAHVGGDGGSQGSQGRREVAQRLRVLRTARHQWRGGVPPPTQLHNTLQKLAREWQANHRQQALCVARVNTWVSMAVDAQLRDDPCYVAEGAELAGLPLVGHAQALGVTFMATGQAVVNWQDVVDSVSARCTRIARLAWWLIGWSCGASG